MKSWANKEIIEALCKLNIKITNQEICSNNFFKCSQTKIFFKHIESKKVVLILLWTSSLIPTPQNDKETDKDGETENKNNANHEFGEEIPQDPSHLIYYRCFLVNK